MYSRVVRANLDQFCVNLTKKASQNQLDPVYGREKELHRLTAILLKRSKSNPLILGDPGVGKTALVEELARTIVNKTCHHDLLDKEIVVLDIAGMVAGTSERGSLEARLTELMEEINENENLIVMIDEIHMLGTSGNSSSRSTANIDAGTSIMNILKPALARGKITCIGATTYKEYSRYIREDKAMERRFQVMVLDEPDAAGTKSILSHINNRYEEFHDCIVGENVLHHIVDLAERYMHYRPFPDKAIDLLDETCSRVKLEHYKKLRKDRVVTEDDVNDVMRSIMEVPIQVSDDNTVKLTTAEMQLLGTIHGQEVAINTVIKTMRRHMCGFHNPNRPIASMLLIGPTGTGKTETVNVLADAFFGSRERNILRFDMSEYMTPNSVSSLIGAPAGYVGYDDDGTLTKGIKRNPYSIVLFDEIEKAHYSVHNILLQIMEDGILTNNKGGQFSFKNAIIVMTSNVGFKDARPHGTKLGFDTESATGFPKCVYNKDDIMNELKYTFRPEFLNRIDAVVPYEYLDRLAVDKIVNDIINAELVKINTLLNVNVVVSNETRAKMVDMVMAENAGARPARAAVNRLLVDPMSERLLNRQGKMKNQWILM